MGKGNDEPEQAIFFQAVDGYRAMESGAMSQIFFQASDQYQNIDATMSSKQYGLKAGLRVFKDGGLKAVSRVINDNLHGRGVIEPVPILQVTAKIQKASLPYLMFLKQKRCGKIKARGCAD